MYVVLLKIKALVYICAPDRLVAIFFGFYLKREATNLELPVNFVLCIIQPL